MTDRILQALCCVCGALRKCQRPRNYRRENYWLSGPIDNDWHRETGDLKCDPCGRITTHAILLPDNTWRDHAEKIHLEAIGYYTKSLTEQDRVRIQQAWRQGLPRNPFTHHIWWIGDETRAREAGDTHLSAICMERVPVPKTQTCKPGDGVDRDVLVEPNEFHDVDYADPTTGLRWYRETCLDCLLRSNAIAVTEQRKALKLKLIEVVAAADRMDAVRVQELLDKFSDKEGAE